MPGALKSVSALRPLSSLDSRRRPHRRTCRSWREEDLRQCRRCEFQPAIVALTAFSTAVAASSIPSDVRSSIARREDRADRVSPALASHARSAAVDRLVDTAPAAIGRATRGADAGRGKQTDRSSKHGRFIGQDVAEHILHDDHVEARRLANQPHRHRVDQHMLDGDIGIVRCDFFDDVSPQTRGREHVHLVDACQLLAAGAGPARMPAARLARSLPRCSAWCRPPGGPDGGPLTRRLAEIDAAGQLTHDHQVGARDDLGLDRGGVRQRRIDRDRPQIGEEFHSLAQGQQPTLWTQARLRCCPRPDHQPRQAARHRPSCRSPDLRGRSGTPKASIAAPADGNFGCLEARHRISSRPRPSL